MRAERIPGRTAGMADREVKWQRWWFKGHSPHTRMRKAAASPDSIKSASRPIVDALRRRLRRARSASSRRAEVSVPASRAEGGAAERRAYTRRDGKGGATSSWSSWLCPPGRSGGSSLDKLPLAQTTFDAGNGRILSYLRRGSGPLVVCVLPEGLGWIPRRTSRRCTSRATSC